MNLDNLEKKYKDELNKIDEWAYIRVALGTYLLNKKGNSSSTTLIYEKIKYIFRQLLYSFYGFKFWFKKYKYLVFTDTAERRLIDGVFIDKLLEDIIERLEEDSTLMIELPNPKHYNYTDISTKNIVSQLPLKFIEKFLMYTVFNKKYNIEILDNILLKERIDFNYINIIKSFNANYLIYKFLLKVYKPELIFVNCHYCRFGLIYASNELGIKTIEIQHGIINEAHFAYRSILAINQKYLPNILLSFGENEVSLKNKLIKKVFPIGSFYLEYLENNFTIDNNLLKITEQYQYVVGVSLQDQEWEMNIIFEFFIECAKEDKNILYILIPRKRKIFSKKLPSNMIVYSDLDCYNIILHCNIHSTLYSSCALEAPSLGIPNILIDIEGFSSMYYKNILSDRHTKYVTTTKEFFKELEKIVFLDKNFIQKNNKNIFIKNYNKNIETILKSEGKSIE